MRRSVKVPILMYHDVIPSKKQTDRTIQFNRVYGIDEADFRKQMEHLKHSGYNSISLSNLIKAEKDADLPDNPVVITFDDGNASNYTVAHPILQEYGFRAIFFVTTNFIGTPGMLSWSYIKCLLNDDMEIGSHTLTHPYPSQLSDSELRYELDESKRILELNLQREIDFLSSPTGYHNKAMGRIAREVGYKALCINIAGGNDVDSDPFSLKRIAIKRSYSISMFNSLVKLEPRMIFRLRVTQILRDSLRRSLGAKICEGIRRQIIAIKGS